MRLYFLRNIRAGFAPNGEYKEGLVYEVPLNNVPTMLDNNFAVPESEKPQGEIEIKKPVKGDNEISIDNPVKKTRKRRKRK
jgi:hypothetical protein